MGAGTSGITTIIGLFHYSLSGSHKLRDFGDPTHVARFVIPGRVWPAVHRMLGRWARPHIFHERPEVIAPAFANRYAAPAIVAKARAPLVGTTGGHFFPGIEKRVLVPAIPRATAAERVTVAAPPVVMCRTPASGVRGLAAPFDGAYSRGSQLNTSTIDAVRGPERWNAFGP